jgi:SAM-dependent methyltransferase
VSDDQQAPPEVWTCKLCLASGCVPAGRNKHREFVHCQNCGLVLVPRDYWVSESEERARYAHHDNSPANEGYVKFLGQVADVVAELGPVSSRVLDFGSGENAVLADLLRQRGFACAAYDPVYGLGQAALRERYDIVVLCEVIEHLRDLRAEMLTLKACLGPGGRVVVRTQCYPSVAELPTWWYARDATHLNFFAPRTLDLAARLCGLRCLPTGQPDIFVWAAEADTAV